MTGIIRDQSNADYHANPALGYDMTIGVDGWPSDPKHPSV